MIKKNRKVNTLIKEVKLKNEFQRAGIKRVNKEAIKYFVESVEKNVCKNINDLSRELIIKGKKTLEKKDIKEYFKKLKEENSWEV